MGTCRFIAAGLLAASIVPAQSPRVPTLDPMRTGAIELGVSGGWAGGDVGGARLNMPGVITYRVEGRSGSSGKLHIGLGMWSRYQFVAEAALLGGGRARADLGQGYRVETKTNAIVYAAGLHIRFPVRRRFVPYAAVGGASVQSRSDTLVQYTAPVVSPGEPLQGATQVRQKEGSFAFMAGTGAQFFPTRKRIGLRVEAKSYFPTGSSRTPFVQITAGILTWLR